MAKENEADGELTPLQRYLAKQKADAAAVPSGGDAKTDAKPGIQGFGLRARFRRRRFRPLTELDPNGCRALPCLEVQECRCGRKIPRRKRLRRTRLHFGERNRLDRNRRTRRPVQQLSRRQTCGRSLRCGVPWSQRRFSGVQLLTSSISSLSRNLQVS